MISCQLPHWLYLWEASREGCKSGSHDWGVCVQFELQGPIITSIQCHHKFEESMNKWLLNEDHRYLFKMFDWYNPSSSMHSLHSTLNENGLVSMWLLFINQVIFYMHMFYVSYSTYYALYSIYILSSIFLCLFFFYLFSVY